MIKFLRTLRWLYSSRPICSLCGEKVRDLTLHKYVDHADGF